MKKLFLPLCGVLSIAAVPALAQKPAAKPAAKPVAVVPKPAPTKPAAPAVTKPVTAAKPAPARPVLSPIPLGSGLETFSNGDSLALATDRTSPRVAYSVLLQVGAVDETPETAGWRRLLTNALLRRAPKGYEEGNTSPESLARAAEKLGGQVGASVGDDLIEIYAVGDSANGTKLLQLALALVKNPAFSDADLDSARLRQAEQLEADDFDITSKVSESLRKQLFKSPNGDLAAYGLSDLGTPQSLLNLSNAKLRELYSTKVLSAKITVSAVGDVNEEGTREIIKSLGASSSKPVPAPVFQAPKKDAPLVVRELPTRSAWVFISYPVGSTAADAPALRVLSAILSDSKGARLPARLLGSPLVQGAPVALTVSSQWVYRRYAGELLLSAQTSSQSVDRVKNALLDEVRKLRDTKLTPQELDRAKTYAIGSWSIERQNLRERAFLNGQTPALGGPSDKTWPARLNAVTADDISRVAKKYLNNYAVALVMPRESE